VSVRGYQLTAAGVDVTSDVMSEPDLSVEWGRDTTQAGSQPTAGELSFALLNDLQQYAPENPNANADVVEGAPAKLTQLDSPHVVMFDGVVDTFATNRLSVAVEAVDAWGKPGQEKLSTALYRGLRTGDAVNVVLDAIGWPTDKRVIDPGATVMPWWWAEDAAAADAIGQLVDSEGPPAVAYVQGGVFVFEDRHHRLLSAASTTSQGLYTVRRPPTGIRAGAADSFDRANVSSSLGTADSGGTWALTGTASDFSILDGYARVGVTVVNSERIALLPAVAPDVTLAGSFMSLTTPTGAPANAFLIARWVDSSNHYRARLAFQTDGTLALGLEKVVGGTFDGNVVPLTSTGISYIAGSRYRFVFQVFGSTLRAKVWAEAGTEPTGWTFEVTDTGITPAAAVSSQVGMRWILSTGMTSGLPHVMKVDDFAAEADVKVLTDRFGYDRGLSRIVNSCSFTVEERAPGGRVEVWSSDDPIVIGSGESVSVWAQPSEPFFDAATPDAGIDYDVASGTVSSVTLSRDSGQSTVITLTASSTAVVTRLALRAIAVPVVRKVKVSAEDPAAGERRTYQRTAVWANAYDAEAIANKVVAMYATARPVVTVEIANLDAAHMAQIRERRISDRISVHNDLQSVAGDFIVEKIRHQVQGLLTHRLQLVCEVPEPTQPGNVFTFDVSGKGFDDGRFGVNGITSISNVFRFDVAGHGFDQGVFAV
jgi:hypothetical protein